MAETPCGSVHESPVRGQRTRPTLKAGAPSLIIEDLSEQCPETDVVHQDLVRQAHEMSLPDETTEKVRKAIAWMHTGGKMGERGDDALMAEVAVATRSTDLDQRRLGITTWCETQKARLAGFVRTRN